MAALKERGAKFGMERKVTDKVRKAIIAAVIKDPGISIKEIAKRFKIGTASFNGNFIGGKRKILQDAAKKRKR